MNGRLLSRVLLCALTVVTVGSAGARAQKAPTPSRVIDQVDDARTVKLAGNVHPMARPAFDQGALPDSQPLSHMLLLLQRSSQQDLALKQLLDAQQTKNSGSYHAWLTPEDFGKQFGPSDADVQAVTDWLTRQGFQVKKVAAGRTVIEFDGNVRQVRNTFHTAIHRYVVNGEEHFANSSDPSIPAALSPAVAGVVALHNFPKHPQIRRAGTFQRDRATGQIKPLFTYTDKNGQFFAVGPEDFAKIYNIPSGADGSGQSIAVVGQSNINIADVQQFRSMFGLPANDPQIIVNGPDPGLAAGDEAESDLDVEWAGAVAPAAKIIFVTTESTLSTLDSGASFPVSGGVDLSALYAVDNNLAPVLSDSYGLCELGLGTTGNAFYLSLWQQASAEGITVAVAAGDNGPAGCDPNTTVDPFAATQGLAVSGLASTPYNVAVGGTDFNTPTAADLAKYWNTTNTSTTPPVLASALGYVPEIPWDDSTCAQDYLKNPSSSVVSCTVDTTFGDDLAAASGGPSNCAISDSSGNCNAGYPKPSFQSGITPADNVRDIPDISLFAGNGINFSFYIVCESDANNNNAPCDLSTSPTSTTENFSGIGGTSGGTPTFAAIMALVNQKTGERQGNANYVLYNLAQTKETYSTCNSNSSPAAGCIFYDIAEGTNTVACDAGSPNCSNQTSSGVGVLIDTQSAYKGNGNPAFKAVQGYDLATGLGSINVANLLAAWTSAIRTATTTTLTSPTGGTPSGTNFTATIKVFPAPVNIEAVALNALASDGTVLGSFGPFTLTAGTAAVSTNLLPPGTVSVQGSYGGDATLAASTSAPVALSGTVAGANQASKVTVFYVGFDSNGNPLQPTTSSQTFQYGSGNGYILKIEVTGTNGTSCSFGYPSTKPAFPCPTGTITLTDNGTPITDFLSNGTPSAHAALNNQGFAEDQPINLNAGPAHNIQASYSGDANYAKNSSNTLTLTISQTATSTALSGTPTTVASGGTVMFTATVSSNSGSSQGPTGSVQFKNGSTVLGSATCMPAGATNTAGASCTATLSAAVSSLYPPPIAGPRTPGIRLIPLIVAALSLLLFALGWRWMPTPRRRASAYAAAVAFALLAVGIAGCGGGGSSGGGGGGGGSTRSITASYAGDTNYAGSTSSGFPITVQ